MNLGPDTEITLALGVVATLVLTLIVATWRAANYLRDVRDEVRDIRNKLGDVWTVRDQERFAARLRWDNRTQNLQVPEPSEQRDKTPT